MNLMPPSILDSNNNNGDNNDFDELRLLITTTQFDPEEDPSSTLPLLLSSSTVDNDDDFEDLNDLHGIDHNFFNDSSGFLNATRTITSSNENVEFPGDNVKQMNKCLIINENDLNVKDELDKTRNNQKRNEEKSNCDPGPITKSNFISNEHKFNVKEGENINVDGESTRIVPFETKKFSNHLTNHHQHHHHQSNNKIVEELTTLISSSARTGNLNEMNSLSVKPDKCAILQETVKQIQNINKNLTTDDLQASEVSSSKPNILPPHQVNSLLLETLNCFLFTLNADGYVEYISENVSQYLKFTQSEVINKSIFDILHPDDHPRFNALLLPMAIGNGLSNSNCWPSSSTTTTSSTSTSTSSSSSTQQQSSSTTAASSSSSTASSGSILADHPMNNSSSSSPSVNLNVNASSSNNTQTPSSASSGNQTNSSQQSNNNIVVPGTSGTGTGTCCSTACSSSTSSSSLIGTLASLNNSSSHNEFNSFNTRFLIKTEQQTSNLDDDDDDDDEDEDDDEDLDDFDGGDFDDELDDKTTSLFLKEEDDLSSVGVAGIGDGSSTTTGQSSGSCKNSGNVGGSQTSNSQLLDALSFDDNEAMAQNDSSVLDSDLAAVLDAASQAESSSSTSTSSNRHYSAPQRQITNNSSIDEKQRRKQRLLLLKRQKKQNKKLRSKESSLASSLSSLPQYELMQVNTKFITNTESKQIDTLTSINSLNSYNQFGGAHHHHHSNMTNSGSQHSMDCSSSHLHHHGSFHHQMTEESRVLCVARPLPMVNEQGQVRSTGAFGTNSKNIQVEQFSTRLDFHGRVMNVDVSTITGNNRQMTYLRNNLQNNLLHDFVHPDDLKKIQQHLKEAFINGATQTAAISKLYRLKVGPDQYAQVSTKTKLLKNGKLMAKHSVFFEHNTLNPVKKEPLDDDDNEMSSTTVPTTTTTTPTTALGSGSMITTSATTMTTSNNSNNGNSNNNQSSTGNGNGQISNNSNQNNNGSSMGNNHNSTTSNQSSESSSSSTTNTNSSTTNSSNSSSTNHSHISTTNQQTNQQWTATQPQPPDPASSSTSMSSNNVVAPSSSISSSNMRLMQSANQPISTASTTSMAAASSGLSSVTSIATNTTVATNDLGIDGSDLEFLNFDFDPSSSSTPATTTTSTLTAHTSHEEPTTTIDVGLLGGGLSSTSLSSSGSFTTTSHVLFSSTALQQSPATTMMISSTPMSSFANNNQTNQLTMSFSPIGGGSMMTGSDGAATTVHQIKTGQQQSIVMVDDKRLRNLLTNRQDSSNTDFQQNSHLSQNKLTTTATAILGNGGNNSNSDNILRDLLDTDDDGGVGGSEMTSLSVIGDDNMALTTSDHLMSVDGAGIQTTVSNNFVDLVTSGSGSKVMPAPLNTSSFSSSSTTIMTSSTTTIASSTSSNNMLRMLLNDEDCLKSPTQLGTGIQLQGHQMQQQRLGLTGSVNINKMVSNDNLLVDHLLKDESANKLDLNSLLSSGTSSGCSSGSSSTTTTQSTMNDNENSGLIMSISGGGGHHIQQHHFDNQSGSNPNKRKQSFDHNQQQLGDMFIQQDDNVNPNKRMATSVANNQQQQSTTASTGHQLLACQNPMLASMLAKTPTSLPEEKIQTIPPSMISSTPDVKLPPNLDKKILPTPNPLQQHLQQQQQQQQMGVHLNHSNLQQQQQQHGPQINQIQLHQTNLMNMNIQQTNTQQQQHPMQNQIQLQIHQQQQHLIATAIGPGNGGGPSGPVQLGPNVQTTPATHIAIKSGKPAATTVSIQQQQIKQQIASGNFQRLQQLRQQQPNSQNSDLQQLLQQQQQPTTIQQQQPQPILQPQVPMSVGQQLVHHQQQQLLQLKHQQQAVQQQQQPTNFLTQILSKSTTGQTIGSTTTMNIAATGSATATQISANVGRVLTATVTTNRQVNLSMLRNVAKVGTATTTIQQANNSQQTMIAPQPQQQFIGTLSSGSGSPMTQMTPPPQLVALQQPTGAIVNNNNSLMTNQQVATQATSNNHLSPVNIQMCRSTTSTTTTDPNDFDDQALSQLLDEVIELQDITSTIGAPSPSSSASTTTLLNNGVGNSHVGSSSVISQPSLSSLLSNTPSAMGNRRTPNDNLGSTSPVVDLAALGLDSALGLQSSTNHSTSSSSSTVTMIQHHHHATTTTTNEQQAISEIRKELMKVESFEQMKQQQQNSIQTSSASFSGSQPPTPQSPMLTNSLQPPPPPLSSPQQQQGPPPNYQSSIGSVPPPSYLQQQQQPSQQTSTTTFNLINNNSQVSNTNIINRMPQPMLMQRMNGPRIGMQRVPMVQQQQQNQTYLASGQSVSSTAPPLVPQQQIQLRISKSIVGQTVVGGAISGGPSSSQQTPPSNLNVTHKRLLMHQEQQDFNVKSQMQNPSTDGGFDLNGLNSINNTVAPNVQITVKPRQSNVGGTVVGSTTPTMMQQQPSTPQEMAQMSPRYATAVVGAGGGTGMQVPSAGGSSVVLPQSPAPGSAQLSPGPGGVNPVVSSTAVLRSAAAGPASSYNNHNATVYASPQTTMAAGSGGGSSGSGTNQQAPSPFSTSRMSPASHFVQQQPMTPGGMHNASASSASPSPAPPVSPMIQQIQSPQSVGGGNGQPIAQINWQQQVSPAPSTSNRIAQQSANNAGGGVPSPAQVMSPSSTSTMHPVQSSSPVTGGPNLVSIQQQSNPMLNAQLSGVGLRFQRPTRLPAGQAGQQGPRLVALRQGQFAMIQNPSNNTGAGPDQQFGHGNQQMTMQNMQHLLQQRQQGQRMIVGNRMTFQQQQQQQQNQQQIQHQIQQTTSQQQTMTNSFTINTQTNVKLSIQSQQQITANLVDPNTFVVGATTANNNSTGIQHSMFTNAPAQPQQQQQISIQQLNLNDLPNFGNADQTPSPSGSQQQFNLDLGGGSMLNDRKSITSDYVKQRLNTFVNERSGAGGNIVVQQQPQQQQMIIQSQQNSQQQQIIQQPNTPTSMTPNTLDSSLYVDFEDSFFDTFDSNSNHSLTNSSINNMVASTLGTSGNAGIQILGTGTQMQTTNNQPTTANNNLVLNRTNSMDQNQKSSSESLLQRLLSDNS